VERGVAGAAAMLQQLRAAEERLQVRGARPRAPPAAAADLPRHAFLTQRRAALHLQSGGVAKSAHK
jgi:hypothetical protein